MKTKWKIIISVLVAVGVTGFGVYSFFRPLAADTETLEKRSLTISFTEEGRVVPLEEYEVYSLTGGEITQLHVEEGDEVQAGDLLAHLDVSDLDHQLRQLQAQLVSLQGEQAGVHQEPYEASITSQELQIQMAEQQLETIQTQYGRMEALYQAGAIASTELENARDMLESAETNLQLQQEALNLIFESHQPIAGTDEMYRGQADALRAQMDLLQSQKEKGRIYSPLSGTIAELNFKAGQPASPSLPLMNIFSASEYEIKVDILSEDVLHVEEAMPVEIIQSRQGQDFIASGMVTRIAPTAVETVSPLGLEEQRVTITVEPEGTEDLLFFPGIRVDVRFETDRFDDVIALRKTLVFPYEDGDAVWVVEDGRAQVRPVTTGAETDREIIIESGLREGDVVILNPQLDGLNEGKRIAP
ncbi:MAG: biotin/lipoyl-binding protein [Tindallia sp. MSAO_Bac2]|nr:MAG: biotin/lipoyl-binding protein [Tindallia sp. MSAO_Bac2]